MSEHYILKRTASLPVSKRELTEGYQMTIWRPTLTQISPPDLPGARSTFFWFLDKLSASRAVGMFMILVHGPKGDVACWCRAMPRFFRFPLLGQNDVLLHDIWTDENHRGKGLASFTLGTFCEVTAAPGRTQWALISKDNTPSLGLFEKFGFEIDGEVERRTRLGSGAMGYWERV